MAPLASVWKPLATGSPHPSHEGNWAVSYVPDKTQDWAIVLHKLASYSLTALLRWYCLALPCRAVPCRAVHCRALPCRALHCIAVPCIAVPCLFYLHRYQQSKPMFAAGVGMGQLNVSISTASFMWCSKIQLVLFENVLIPIYFLMVECQ